MKKEFLIYTDGACRVHSSGLGAWGYVIIDPVSDSIIVEGSGVREPKTTSPMMELMAVLKSIGSAINTLPRGDVIVHSDSEVVIRGITEWLPEWKVNNWRRSNGRSVKNKGLWKALDSLTEMFDVNFKWVKGHNGNKWNEYVHNLCESALREYELINQTNKEDNGK